MNMTSRKSCTLLLTLLLIAWQLGVCHLSISSPHNKRALQADHEKPKPVKWRETFIDKKIPVNYQMKSMVKLLHFIAKKYLDKCTVMILYDTSILLEDSALLHELLADFPLPFVQGTLNAKEPQRAQELRQASPDNCVSYILFLSDVMRCREVVGDQNESKLVIVARSSQWRVHEFLANEVAQNYVNLLVIARSEKASGQDGVIPYILYTHDMYIDGLGSSRPRILASWYKGKLSRPYIRLFPKKMTKGFAGHRFIIAIADQPPYVINRGKDSNDDVRWDGVEVRLIKLLSEMLNFTRDYHEAKEAAELGSGEAVVKMMREGKSNLGLSGLYITQDRAAVLEMSHGHTQDCAVFISLTSTALPRYRAILGPFQWTVWLALTLVYLFAIFPIAFSDKLTLMHLIKRPEEMENMFWYVFGTFTNCFTFSNRDSWSNSSKLSTRLFIGFYWIFTIIISACYTGSVIAFVTLPVYPSTVDTVQQLIDGRFQVGTLDRGGWQYWFENSTDKASERLFRNMEYLPDVQSGLRNITTAFFWPYAFLGSRDQLDYIVRTNFTTSNKRSVLHISSECFVPFSVGIALPKDSVYKSVINSAVLRAFQSGLVTKLKNDVQWDIMRSSTGKLLQANSVGAMRIVSAEDRSLTLADTQGMFLLLALGYILGGSCLVSEWLGGCLNFFRGRGRRSRLPSVVSNDSSRIYPTPRTQPKREEINGDATQLENGQTCEVVVHEEVSNNIVIIEPPSAPPENTSVREDEQGVESPEDTHEDISDLEERISEIFNFDYLFGENSSVATIESLADTEALPSDYSDIKYENDEQTH